MESSLANFLGCASKDEIHNILKPHLGQVVNLETGKTEYESLSLVTDCERMMHRIYEFQQFVAIEFDYTFEPFNENPNDGLDGFAIINQTPGGID